jgi:8-oxo-dGTP diphosphatase
MGGDPTKHYVTVFVHATVLPESGELTNMEPEKCFGWEWAEWSELRRLSAEQPDGLFEPLAKFVAMHDQFSL